MCWPVPEETTPTTRLRDRLCSHRYLPAEQRKLNQISWQWRVVLSPETTHQIFLITSLQNETFIYQSVETKSKVTFH